jgi:hypothetical protein
MSEREFSLPPIIGQWLHQLENKEIPFDQRENIRANVVRVRDLCSRYISDFDRDYAKYQQQLRKKK